MRPMGPMGLMGPMRRACRRRIARISPISLIGPSLLLEKLFHYPLRKLPSFHSAFYRYETEACFVRLWGDLFTRNVCRGPVIRGCKRTYRYGLRTYDREGYGRRARRSDLCGRSRRE